MGRAVGLGFRFKRLPVIRGLAFFKAGSTLPEPIDLRPTFTMPASGFVDVTYSQLTSPEGWGAGQSLPGSVTAGDLALTLYPGTSAGETSLEIVGHNGAGGASAVATFTLKPDGVAPAGVFTSPAAGTFHQHASSLLTVSWDDSDVGSGLASYSVERRKAQVAVPGSCEGLTLEAEGSHGDYDPGPTVQIQEADLRSGFCYQWVLTVTDHVGNAATFSSGLVLVDLTAPAVAFTTPPAGQTLVTSQSDYSVAWTEVEAESGVATRTLQRQSTPLGSDGVCAEFELDG